MMKKFFTLFYLFQFGENRFGKLQLPRNLRLGHCDVLDMDISQFNNSIVRLTVIIQHGCHDENYVVGSSDRHYDTSTVDSGSGC